MEISFEVHFGPGQGFGFDRGRWQNQHGQGVYFTVRCYFFLFEFRTDAPLV